MFICYLDDIIVFSETFDDHLQRLRSILKCIQDDGLVLNPKKYVFCSRKIKNLRELVSEEGIMQDPEKVRAVQNFPAPKNIHDVRSFLRLCSYYRRFSKDFCLKAQPLQELLKNDSKFTWGSDQKESFEKLKTALTSVPVLGLFAEKAPTKLHVDASGYEDDYVSRLIVRAEESRQLVRIRTLEAQHRDKTRYDARHRSVSYRPGELVWVFMPVRKVGLSEKLIQHFFGPYRVVVHVLRMKKYYTPEAQVPILTNDTKKLSSNSPAGATYNVGTDKTDTPLDSPGEIVPYRGPMTRSRARKVKEL
ncbi:retrovirus-related Pol polyprotein from transposon gypsy [Trichonephila inaurata madagascariensis]|uniref:Retrovirus-related Pol polyprotein from transposon gypsy n=1 Tax=Trichonephila inaurata madagascariensis TaxID=2747483 RepID=A0A8X6XI00_9ARAC|nr:retrovirus-related Pol polyprotein from transposon gypsy [Trichonephila inaurata madagascariensis]